MQRGKPVGRLQGSLIVIASAIFFAAIWSCSLGEQLPSEACFCGCVTGLVAIVFVAITRRIGFSLLLSAALMFALLAISAAKTQYLGTSLFVPDLQYFSNSETLAVIAQYPEIWHYALTGGLIAVFLLLAMWCFERPLGLHSAWHKRWVAQIFAFVLTVGGLFAVFAPGGPFKILMVNNPWGLMVAASPTTSFLLSIHHMRVIVPQPDPAAADRYEWAPVQPVIAAKKPAPDIVVVLEESTFDPHTLSLCTIPQCDAQMFRDDAQTNAHGALRVHAWGGGTWTSEFAFLTSLPTPMFGPGGIYAPYNLAPRISYSLPRLLKTQGYRSIAIYPLDGNFVNARHAYNAYGFDEFYDNNIFHFAWVSTDLDLEHEFEKIYRDERAKTDQPLFFMILTMRQHGPHNDALEKLAAPFNQPLFASLDETRNRNMSNYLARLHGSDEALAAMQKTLFSGSRPAVLVHFGDHQPSFDGLMLKIERTAAAKALGDPYTVTYYKIDGSSADSPRFSYPTLDLGFLAGLIIDVAGLPEGAFFQANALMRERCGGRYLDCKDKELLESYQSHLFNRLHVIGR
ncbi:hypothetical protein ELE36_14600 [Pseudolysobacter antarcticus]|uniref:Sulfatase N-terminal domain-containing protein n=1 Tax=Pseudolysobacter antarcticus TaxID=2511995 RepID=A0A411HM95_9GAMM|nr:LTA synthase family protein [Pseudolysobacter antarcticus]QBB71487.1 hypothetical protein ELE36_14600 [Pseudolysobacter antarcticus]